jgi:PAS domain S-box-containing protein
MISHAEIIAKAARLLGRSRDWMTSTPEVLATLGEGLDASRAAFVQIQDGPGGGLIEIRPFGWAAPGWGPAVREGPREAVMLDDAATRDLVERHRRGEIVAAHTRDLGGALRAHFEARSVKSFISAPIIVNGQWWGHAGFDDCVRERDWTASEMAVLETIAALFSDAISLSTSSLIMSEATRIAMLQTAPDGIAVVDETGAILDFNPAAEAIFGLRRAGVIGRDAGKTLIPPHARRQFAGVLRRLRRGGARGVLGRHIETAGLHASGAEVPLELAVSEIRQGGRRLFVAYARDLTARKRAETNLERQREALHQSEKMAALGSLLAGVAHELNNPLSVVIGRAVMIEEDIDDPVQKERLRKLREAAERCAKVSKTFLAMARRHPPARVAMQVNKAIATALDLVAYSLKSSGIAVDLQLDAALPPIIGDHDQMIQIFVNLFVNAEHAMRGHDGVRTLKVASSLSGGRIVVTVKDTGPGIDAEALPRVFEPFYTTKEVGAGTGLGLAVSFGMAAAHGGTLEALAMAPGEGACFRLVLPVEAIDAAPELEAPAPPKSRGQNVLVVDDEPEVAALLRDILERAGHRTSHAENGQAALDLAAQERFDAVFCDLRMPVMDGRGLRRRLVTRQPIYEKRIAFVTGDLLSHDGMGEDFEGCPLIEKPFHARAILDTLDRIAGLT